MNMIPQNMRLFEEKCAITPLSDQNYDKLRPEEWLLDFDIEGETWAISRERLAVYPPTDSRKRGSCLLFLLSLAIIITVNQYLQ